MIIMNKILVSSDHHANWKCLEYWFSYASKNKLAFVINGDVVGDYNFEELALKKNLEVPNSFSEGNSEVIEKLQKLYLDILFFHAKKFSDLIDTYGVKTYFLHGNHEPIFFGDMVLDNLKDKSLFVDLNKSEGFLDVDGIKIAGISNTSQLMPFLYSIYDIEKLGLFFSHQLTQRKVVSNFTEDIIKSIPDPVDDFDWIRITKKRSEVELFDVFFTHGQIGRGAWRKDKYANELPTLLCAAKLGLFAKLCVDGHLHTTHMMRNDIGKPVIRAVGNKAFLIEKDTETQSLDVLELKAPFEYNARGGLCFEDLYPDAKVSDIDNFLNS